MWVANSSVHLCPNSSGLLTLFEFQRGKQNDRETRILLLLLQLLIYYWISFPVFFLSCSRPSSCSLQPTMPPKKVFAKPTKRPAPVLASVSASAEGSGADASDPTMQPPASEQQPSQQQDQTADSTMMHIDPALGFAGDSIPPTEAAAPVARSTAPTARAIGASMRKGESGAGSSSQGQAAKGGETKPRIVFKPTVPVRKVKQE